MSDKDYSIEDCWFIVGDGTLGKDKVWRLNDQLIKDKQLSIITIRKLMKVHQERHSLIQLMKMEDPDTITGRRNLKILANKIKMCDFELQGLWGFNKDDSYHAFWELPHCKCPTMDNKERVGQKNWQIYDGRCPIHGKC
jgi:hypothetical protein